MCTVIVYAEHIHWLGDYDLALEKAKTEQKPLMVLLVKEGCTECRNVIRDYFTDQPYVAKLNAKSVGVIVTYEGKNSYPIELFYSTEFPTLFFVDSRTESFIGRPLYGTEIGRDQIEKRVKGL